MADPFDVVDILDADEERRDEPAKSAGAPVMSDPFDVVDAVDAEPGESETKGTGSSWQDFLISLADGSTLGNTRNLSKLEDNKYWPAIADAISPVLGGATRAVHALAPGAQREFLERMADQADRAQQTPAGQAGRVIGTGVTSIGASALAGPAVGAQMLAGAGLGAASGAGESGGDLMATLMGAGGGALLSGTGGLVGKAANAVASGADDILKSLPKPSIPDWITSPVKSALATAGRSAATAPRAMNAAASMARGAGAFSASGGGSLAGMAAGKAKAQADVAYGTAPTMAWAVESVLQSGASGLDPADEQQLTEAVMSGDEDRLIAANFTAQQRSPAFAARLRRELESLQEE